MSKATPISLDIISGMLAGNVIVQSKKRIRDLRGIFQDESAREAMDQELIIYAVQAYMPVKEGTAGGLFFGNTAICPGKVGKEYYMTRGHFHARVDSGEYYWCVQGQGVLILMDRDRHMWSEAMTPGSVHYIPGNAAHRVANTGTGNLVFNACWPSDAGHDYETVQNEGFQARLLEVNGAPRLMNV